MEIHGIAMNIHGDLSTETRILEEKHDRLSYFEALSYVFASVVTLDVSPRVLEVIPGVQYGASAYTSTNQIVAWQTCSCVRGSSKLEQRLTAGRRTQSILRKPEHCLIPNSTQLPLSLAPATPAQLPRRAPPAQASVDALRNRPLFPPLHHHHRRNLPSTFKHAYARV